MKASDLSIKYKAELDELVKTKVNRSNMPIAVFIQEARNIIYLLQSEFKKFKKIGYSEQQLKRTEELLLLLQDAHTASELIDSERKNREIDFKEQLNALKTERNDLIAVLKFLFRNSPDKLNTINEISKGSSQPDLIQDVTELSIFFTKNQSIIEKADITQGKINELLIQANDFSELLSQITFNRDKSIKSKNYRNAVYLLLKKEIDEVKSIGKFLFRKEDIKKKNFASPYFRSH